MSKKKTIETWVIFDPEGNQWKTPGGKAHWSGSGPAKNAWNCHNIYRNARGSYRNLNWKEDAEPKGWTCTMLSEEIVLDTKHLVNGKELVEELRKNQPVTQDFEHSVQADLMEQAAVWIEHVISKKD